MKESICKEIGERIQLIRKKLNFLQKDFAKSLDISNASLSEMESGNAKPRFRLIFNLTKKHNVNLHYLLYGEGEIFLEKEVSSSKDFKINTEHQTFFKEFLFYFNSSHLVRTAMMNYFRAYILEKEKLIEKDMQKAQQEDIQEDIP